MLAEVATPVDPNTRKRRRTRARLVLAGRWAERQRLVPRLELGFALAAVMLGIVTYLVLTNRQTPGQGFSPAFVSLLLVANLVPVMALLVLIARRVIILLAERREGRAGSRLHLRVVGLFAAVAAFPTLLVAAFAALLFQYGVQFWFSDRARTVLQNADQVAQAYVEDNKGRLVGDVIAMASDMRANAEEFGVASPEFTLSLAFQIDARNLTEAAVFDVSGGKLTPLAAAGLDNRPLSTRIRPTDLAAARAGVANVIASAPDRIEAIARIDPDRERYIFASRRVDPAVLDQVRLSRSALDDYKAMTERSRTLQWRFSLMLIVVSLLLLAAVIWAALRLATRLTAPLGRLVVAAERVGAGDFSARVPLKDAPDEIGVLSRTFNRMTHQLDTQNKALNVAREQIDRRRQLTEAVLAGVSAGVLALDGEDVVRLMNGSAADLLEIRAEDAIGRPLAEIAPALLPMLERAQTAGETASEVTIPRGHDTQTLAVRLVRLDGYGGGAVLTFDDISEQLADQRRAAWSDVARRIAHEIKNPLTPIQLSAERLQRKYGRHIADDPETFASLTGTIVRQVGDLRRMVDEFSSFARMPKPVFHSEPLLDIARQALLLQELAHPTILFEIEAPAALPSFTCDRRQIAQALTNLLKNAAESVEARAPDRAEPGRVTLGIVEEEGFLAISIADNGIGLPVESRARLTEPYVTTRARGTGLGLAIVKKIVEDHEGELLLADVPQGGASVTMRFTLGALAARADDAMRSSALAAE